MDTNPVRTAYKITRADLHSATAAQTDRHRPLVLTRHEAARMCSISVQTFDCWVRKGILPGPIPGTRRWSRCAIERLLAGGVAETSSTDQISPFEQWKRANAH